MLGPLTEPRLLLVFVTTFGLTLAFGQLEVGYPAYATALAMPALAGALLAINSIGSPWWRALRRAALKPPSRPVRVRDRDNGEFPDAACVSDGRWPSPWCLPRRRSSPVIAAQSVLVSGGARAYRPSLHVVLDVNREGWARGCASAGWSRPRGLARSSEPASWSRRGVEALLSAHPRPPPRAQRLTLFAHFGFSKDAHSTQQPHLSRSRPAPPACAASVPSQTRLAGRASAPACAASQCWTERLLSRRGGHSSPGPRFLPVPWPSLFLLVTASSRRPHRSARWSVG